MLLDVDARQSGSVDSTAIEVVSGNDGVRLILRWDVVDVGENAFVSGVVGEVVTKMRWLVVGYILPADAHAVCVVVHEGWHTDVGGLVGGEYLQGAVVGWVPKNHFLAPVTEDVARKIWSVLGAVACGSAVVRHCFAFCDIDIGTTVGGVVADIVAIEQFVIDVVSPLDAEVHGWFLGTCRLTRLAIVRVLVAIGCVESSVSRPEFSTTNGWDDVGSTATSVVVL